LGGPYSVYEEAIARFGKLALAQSPRILFASCGVAPGLICGSGTTGACTATARHRDRRRGAAATLLPEPEPTPRSRLALVTEPAPLLPIARTAGECIMPMKIGANNAAMAAIARPSWQNAGRA
jgi:hypothetical protein